MPQSFACLHVHVVFSTKFREPLITPDLAPRLYSYLGGAARVAEAPLIAVGGIADHIHLLVSLGRCECVADLVRDLKANSSAWVHATFPAARFAWQGGYGAFAVSKSNVEAVRAYIGRQEEHHRKQNYQDEYREFLTRHEQEWDERYVWD
ncbi:IS200/IS605 family transposase [Gemmata sp. JC673]|uniref:IS200/IS605 family transposase n=1 Tax=Gemmata algarum TaxID=2975278 RepID=A0ABU5F824_9BACT|nr:IS200/IS605 family transposase [Gemmata algarum]MDY3563755.1 IS200/IS605 family transposase [Gemmata algarum]